MIPECYPNCGCSEMDCRLGLPPMEEPAQYAEEEELENDLYRLHGWSPFCLPIAVTGPLVVLTALYPEPVVIIPKSRQQVEIDQTSSLLKLSDWAKNGFSNWGTDTDFPNVKSIGSGGLKRLEQAGSWFTSGDPLVRSGVRIFALGLTDRAVRRYYLRPETIEEKVRNGWDGSHPAPMHREEVQSPRLSLWKTYSPQLKWRSPVSSARLSWGLICLWSNSWRPKKWRKTIPLSSPLTGMQRLNALRSVRDIIF